MPVTMSFRSCERCGAIVTVASSEGGGVDNEDAHAGWHEELDKLLTLLTAGTQASAVRLRNPGRFQ